MLYPAAKRNNRKSRHLESDSLLFHIIQQGNVRKQTDMKRVWGYTLFWFAMGMMVMLVLSNELFGIFLIGICLVMSFFLFSSC